MLRSIRKKDKQSDKKSLFAVIRDWFGSSGFRCTLVVLAASLLIFTMYCFVCAPRRYDLKVGSISHETVNATKDVVDEVTTEERRQNAAAAVEPSYRFVEGVKEEVLSALNATFGQMRTVQQYGITLRNEDGTAKASFSDTEIEYAIELTGEMSLSRYQVSTLLRTSTEQFEEMVQLVTTATENSLNTTIREGQVTQSIQTIQQIVGYKLDVSLTQNIVPSVLRMCIQPNMIIEQESTDAARTAAMEAVEPVMYLQGQNIVREGDKVTRSQLEMLRALGLLKNNVYDMTTYGGALLIVTLSMIVFVLLLWMCDNSILHDLLKTSVAMIVMVLGVLFAVLSHSFFSAYMVPVVFVPLMMTVLLGAGVGSASIIPISILNASLAAGNNSTYAYEMILLLLMCVAGGAAVVWFQKGHAQRVRVLLAGLISAIVSVLIIIAMKLMTSSENLDIINTGLWAVAGSLLSGVLVVALQPVLESIFHLATPSRLLELSNPNQPMMKRLMLEAPGTYHHSIVVANLAVAAAEKIGANPYLARAGAYYHDIGKLKRPGYFKENQMGDNPHDRTDPFVSAAILTSHTRDGLQLARSASLPREVQDIIVQHHGDTPVMYFYHKALQMSNGNPVDIRDFRYEGSRPQTKEAAIVMLADTVEAAVRSMQDPTPKAITRFMEQLIREKLEDGQLSESPLSLRDLDGISEAFSTVLKGVFHERIEYPEVKHHVPVQQPTQLQKEPVTETLAVNESDISAHVSEPMEGSESLAENSPVHKSENGTEEILSETESEMSGEFNETPNDFGGKTDED